MAKAPLGLRVKQALRILRGVQRREVEAASSHRLLSDWLASRLTPDDEVRWTLGKLRARARQMEREDATVRHYLRLLSISVVGPLGARLQAQVRNNDGRLNRLFNDRLEDGWQEWAYRPTRDGRMDLPALQRLLLKTVARDGEAFVRMHRAYDGNPFGFALEPVDPDMVDENLNRAPGRGVNEVRMGVEVDGDGRPVAYHGWDVPNGTMSGAARRAVRYPATDMLHLYDPERVNQTRGVTWLQPVMVPLRMLNGYVEAELVAARVSAAKMGFFQRKAGDGLGAAEPGDDGSFTMEANPGTFGVVPDGYELSTFSPDHPATAFGQFVKDATRRTSTGLGVSYNALGNDLESVNYSSIRAGMLVERDMWRVLQAWWESQFLRPIYAEWLNMALLSGAVSLDSRDFRKFKAAHWTPRGFQWVDPLKDAQAGVMAVNNALSSRTMLLAEQGLDYEDVLEQLAEEQVLAEEYGVELAPAAAPAGDKVDTEQPADEDEPEPEDEGGEGDGTGEGGRNGGGKPRGHAGTGHPNRLLALLRARVRRDHGGLHG